MKIRIKGIIRKVSKIKKIFSLRLFIVIGIIIVLFAGGYFGYTQIKSYQAKQAEKERQAQELIKIQQEALVRLETEVQQQKQEANTKISNLQQQIDTEKNKSKDLTIQASELELYLTGIVEVSCDGRSGSGFLWKNESRYLMITNKHVIETPLYDKSKGYYCFVKSHDATGKTLNAMYAYLSTYYTSLVLNSVADIFASQLEVMELGEGFPAVPVENLNYKLNSLQRCPTLMPVGSPIVMIGYPAFGKQVAKYPDIELTESNRIATEGIISGHDTVVSNKYIGNMPYSNYFVSAKIDSGNSGGIAISKNKNGLCLLGIPTWLSLGNYETQGMVQNIHNVFYRP